MKSETNCKTIGLVLADPFTDYAKDIAHSVVHQILSRKDLNLVMVPGRVDDNTRALTDSDFRYRRMYNSIYSINGKCHFDGLLVTFPDLINRIGDLYKDTPRVFIASEQANEITVNYDNEKGILEALDFLVRIRGFTRLCMLGGRDDSADAQKRKSIFFRYLSEAGLPSEESQYEKTDMSLNTQEAAARLLKRNPEVQAVFCVNDPAAAGLYDVMRKKGLVPGKDIYVFGFDNTAMAAQMVPPLASIGTDGTTVGGKALELLLDQIEGREVSSAVIPTRLFGRASFSYETYEITSRDILNVDSAFIYSFFDDCFYRYRNEVADPAAIDFRRLFYEILSEMIFSLKNRYMDEKQYAGIKRLIDIFFENGAMRYTDSNKFVRSISRLQSSMNETLRGTLVNSYYNRLFSYMRDKAIQAQALAHSMEMQGNQTGRNNIFDFMIRTVNYGQSGEEGIENVIRGFGKIGFRNAALYLFDEPVEYSGGGSDSIPDRISLRCVLKDGDLYEIPTDRRECLVEEIYTRNELPAEDKGYASFPLFYGKYLFGILVTGISRNMMESGEYLSFLLGKTIYTNLFLP